MSTIKANTIQPINAATGLVLRTNEVDRLNINTSGDVGIGVSPSYKLHVSGTCAIVPNTNVGMRIYEDTDSANFLRFRPLSSTGSQTGFMFSGDDDSPHLTINYTSLVSGSPRIGIGTASPAVALDVNGTIKTNTALVLGGATFAAPSGTAPLFGVRAWVRFTVNSSSAVTIVNSGNVSSVTRSNTGLYTITFAVPLPDGYAVAGIANEFRPAGNANPPDGSYNISVNFVNNASATTTSCAIAFANLDINDFRDPEVATVIFVG